jgi:hypothetical protein
MPKSVANSIDRLITIEIRYGGGNLPRGVKIPLYEAARAKQGGDPLVYLAGRKLLEHVKPKDTVLFVTGAGSRTGLVKGETDGPLGAASLARALDFGLGVRTVFATEPAFYDPVYAAVEAAGLSVLDMERLQKRPHSTVVEKYPGGAEQGRSFAAHLLDTYQPKAVVFVEKVGPSAKGTFHSITGTQKDPAEVAHAFHLVELARERGIFSLGIGDGGNEIGNGVIYDDVVRLQPAGPTIATVTATDVLVFASVSNWGAYGVAAYLSYELKNRDAFQTEEMEDFMLRQCVAAGGQDGTHAAQMLGVDGTSLRTQLALVGILREIVDHGLKTFSRPF